MTRATARVDPPVDVTGFERVLCAVDGSDASAEAAHQAALLAGPDGTLTFLSVTDDPARARNATRVAQATAAADGMPSTATVVPNGDVGGAILAAARDADLLVLGAHNRSRLAGIILGGTTARALHSSPTPVLVARSHPVLVFPGTVLVGTRGGDDRDAVLASAAIAARHGSRIVLAHAGSSSPATAGQLDTLAAEVLDVTGREPVVMSVGGSPADRLPAMAASIGAGLIVIGSRGLRGPRALASVSERVAHRAPCSVLVLRGTSAPVA